MRWTIVGYMNHMHDIACRYSICYAGSVQTVQQNSWCCCFCRPHLASNEIHHHGGLGKNSLTPHTFTSQKHFICSQTDHKMWGFILALLCNTCSQEWGSEIKRGSVQGPTPEREVVYQAANQAANLQLCLLSARLTSQWNHTLTLQHSHVSLSCWFYFFQTALKSGGCKPLTACVNTKILSYTPMSQTLVFGCWFLVRQAGKDEK